MSLAEVAEGMGLAIGVVTAHEMGHALGLVPDGLPPEGLFGGLTGIRGLGDRVTSLHADYPGLNLMEAGTDPAGLVFDLLDDVTMPPGSDLGDIARYLVREIRLSAYSRAYLQGRLTYGSMP